MLTNINSTWQVQVQATAKNAIIQVRLSCLTYCRLLWFQLYRHAWDIKAF